mgnify:CR=1 FL=1
MTEPSVATVAEPEDSELAQADGGVSGDSARPAGRKKAVAVKSDEPITAKPLQALAGNDRLDLLSNIEMDVTAELGRTRMTVRELLSLTPGIVVELDRMAGSPIDLFVNGTLIARGEVVVIDEEFGVRISEIVNPGAVESTR